MVQFDQLQFVCIAGYCKHFSFHVSHNEPMCLFCKKKTHKKIKQMTMVRTFQACETIVQTATVRAMRTYCESLVLLLTI